MSRTGWQVPLTLVALAGLVAALHLAPPAGTAPGDLADLSVSKTDSPDPVLVSAPLVYTIRVANLGPQGATEVVVTDRLPSHADFVSATTTSGACGRKGKRVTCEVGDLALAGTVTVTIQVRPTKVWNIGNTASVDSVENDPIALNDIAEASTTVIAPPRVVKCRGVPATVVGTRGPDRLVGTGGPDVIAGFRGDDRILGLGGRDRICAGPGNDRITAGSAADRVFGGPGADVMRGRGAPDLLVGNAGRDVLVGNRGDDRLRGGRGFDRCYGGPGRDRLRGCERQR